MDTNNKIKNTSANTNQDSAKILRLREQDRLRKQRRRARESEEIKTAREDMACLDLYAFWQSYIDAAVEFKEKRARGYLDPEFEFIPPCDSLSVKISNCDCDIKPTSSVWSALIQHLALVRIIYVPKDLKDFYSNLLGKHRVKTYRREVIDAGNFRFRAEQEFGCSLASGIHNRNASKIRRYLALEMKNMGIRMRDIAMVLNVTADHVAKLIKQAREKARKKEIPKWISYYLERAKNIRSPSRGTGVGTGAAAVSKESACEGYILLAKTAIERAHTIEGMERYVRKCYGNAYVPIEKINRLMKPENWWKMRQMAKTGQPTDKLMSFLVNNGFTVLGSPHIKISSLPSRSEEEANAILQLEDGLDALCAKNEARMTV